MPRSLPSGTVTFLFTDVEGSTRLLHALGAEGYADALATHRRLLRQACARHGGVEVDTQGDALFVAFPTAPGALAAAREATAALADGPIRVRIGLHTGSPLLGDEGYIGPDVHKGARIAAAGHGGQILVSAATAQLVDGAQLRDLGLHRLKDLAAAERIFQADPDQHPPLKTISNTNLPRGLGSFVGRKRETEEVAAHLEAGARLLTLTGPGGTGKTRLALEVAGRLVPRYADGVFWVALADTREPRLALEDIGRVIGAKASLDEAIADRQMLLVLDNLEQVIEVAAQLASLIASCGHLQMLVTSREVLRVRGEVEYPLHPMAEADAVALFSERASRQDSRTAELCRRLDNLPLAVELAAARARVMTPTQILDRLSARLDLFHGGRDADTRQSTLRAAIDWSYELLDADERQLFSALGVFRGGWTLDAAEEVATADVDILSSLVEKSLVVHEPERFGMLQTIRAYAEERLSSRGDATAVRDRHLAFFTALAETWYEARFADEGTWMPQVVAETDNVRAALEWAADREPAAMARLAGAVSAPWMIAGRASEARPWVVRAVERHTRRDEHRARALMYLGEIDDDLERLVEALAIWRSIGDSEGEAAALESIGWVHDTVGDYAGAEKAYLDSLGVRRRAGSPEVRGLAARAGLCHALVATGRSAEARTAAASLLAAARGAGAEYIEELALHFLADADLLDAEWSAAQESYRTALAFAVDHALLGRATDEALGMAMAVAGAGRSRDAARIAAATRLKQVEIGKGSDSWWSGMQDRLIGGARRSLSAEDAARADAEGEATSFDAILDELLRRG